MKVKVKLDNTGFEVEIEDNEQNQDYIESILKKIDEFITNKQELITSILHSAKEQESKNSLLDFKINDETTKDLKNFENPTEKNLNISKGMDENLAKFATELKIDAIKISRIYDFGSKKYINGEFEVPPIQTGACTKNDTRVTEQREALLLLLLAKKILNNENSLSSRSLTQILTASSINSTDLSNVKSTEFVKMVKTEGRSYRITPLGEIKAKELLNEKISNLD